MLDLNPMQMVARQALATPVLVQAAPAAFAETPDPNRTSQHYQFISTARVCRHSSRRAFSRHAHNRPGCGVVARPIMLST
jgi:hypothetical protein